MEEESRSRFFHPERPLERYRRNLPHWNQDGVATFVTFRLADSIPKERLAAWDGERRRWLVSHGRTTQGALHDVLSGLSPDERTEYLREFGRRFHSMLDDCHGSCSLRVESISGLVEQTLRHFDGIRYLLGAYAIMPNHVHVLVSPLPGFEIDSIVRSWKTFSAREINRLKDTRGQFWQRESFDHLVRDAASLRRFERYIENNPTKAQLRTGEFALGRGSMSKAAEG